MHPRAIQCIPSPGAPWSFVVKKPAARNHELVIRLCHNSVLIVGVDETTNIFGALMREPSGTWWDWPSYASTPFFNLTAAISFQISPFRAISMIRGSPLSRRDPSYIQRYLRHAESRFFAATLTEDVRRFELRRSSQYQLPVNHKLPWLLLSCPYLDKHH